jgi:hypothetical protein
MRLSLEKAREHLLMEGPAIIRLLDDLLKQLNELLSVDYTPTTSGIDMMGSL